MKKFNAYYILGYLLIYKELLQKDPEALKNAGRGAAKYLAEKGYEFGVRTPTEYVAITVLSGLGVAQSVQDEEGGKVIITKAAIPTIYREMYGISSSPICKFQEGLLEESISRRTGKKVTVREVSCIAMGSDSCVFEVKYEPQ